MSEIRTLLTSDICHLTSYSSQQRQDDDDHQDEPEHAARSVAPAAAVRPGRERADQQQDQNDDQNGGAHGPKSSVFSARQCAAAEKVPCYPTRNQGSRIRDQQSASSPDP